MADHGRLEEADEDDDERLNSETAFAGMPRMVTENVSVVITRTPTSVPTSENLPPASEVPPMTTARMASSSMNRPALLASAAMMSELRMNPAMHAKNAHRM